MNESPKELDYRMPGEWEKHQAVWLAWPYDRITFGSLNEKDERTNEERLKIVENIYKQILEVLKNSEKVNLITREKVDYADVWTRDYMPVFVKDNNGKLVAIKLKYNAYGEKFEALTRDDKVWGEVNKESNIETIDTGVVLEAGALESNGAGVLLTTEECINARGLNKEEATDFFAKYLGMSKIIWLKKGLVNDHTDGHIDEIARFVSPNKILCAFAEDTQDENYERLRENFEILENATDQKGNKFEIIKLPIPNMHYSNGTRTPASYTNFFIGNKVVLAPIFNDKNDEKAISIIKSCFPDREVVPIDCTDLIYGGGALHCITRDEPAV